MTDSIRTRISFRNRGEWLIRISLALSLLNLLPFRHYLLELNNNLGAYYLFAHLLSLLLFAALWKTRRRLKLSAGSLALLVLMSCFYVLPLSPFYIPAAREAQACSDSLRLFYANVHGPSKRYADLKTAITSTRPDVVALIEARPAWIRALELEKIYPYNVTAPREDNYGMALYSSFPIGPRCMTAVGDIFQPLILCTLLLSHGREVDLALVHAQPPLSAQAMSDNRVMLRCLSTFLRHSDREVLAAGDFNATPYSAYYRNFMNASRLKDAMRGYGMLRSWNAWYPFLRFTLDHVFYRGNLRVKNFSVLPAAGSDHFPYLVDFDLLPGDSSGKAQHRSVPHAAGAPPA